MSEDAICLTSELRSTTTEFETLNKSEMISIK